MIFDRTAGKQQMYLADPARSHGRRPECIPVALDFLFLIAAPMAPASAEPALLPELMMFLPWQPGPEFMAN